MILRTQAGSRIALVPKRALAAAQLEHINSRLEAEVHKRDSAIAGWDLDSYAPNFYVAFLCESGTFVGILYAWGEFNQADASWWIDSDYRGRGYGREAVVLLANMLRERGYVRAGHIRVNTFAGEYDQASRKLRELFIETLERRP